MADSRIGRQAEIIWTVNDKLAKLLERRDEFPIVEFGHILLRIRVMIEYVLVNF